VSTSKTQKADSYRNPCSGRMLTTPGNIVWIRHPQDEKKRNGSKRSMFRRLAGRKKEPDASQC
jgi:hypothetical protein